MKEVMPQLLHIRKLLHLLQVAGSGARLLAAGCTPGAVSLARVYQRVATRTRRLDARRHIVRATPRLYVLCSF